MKNKKSQVQIMETIAIMLIFFILLILGFVFYLKIASYGQADEITKKQELESIQVSQTISFLPELQCSSKNIIKDNCFDKIKMEAFISISNKESDVFYYDLFRKSTIKVEQIYPSEKSWTLYNRTSNGTLYKSFIPILLYDPAQKTNSFGLLIVDYYS